MRRIGFLFALISLWAAFSPASAQGIKPPLRDKVEAANSDEIAERTAIMETSSRALARRDYAALEAMARHFRQTRVRTPSGTWKLPYLYYGLGYGLPIKASDGSCQTDLIAADRAWLKASPNDPAPIIALAMALESYAECLRGSGYASTVTPERMAGFHRNAQAAQDLLAGNKALASTDPQFYAVSANLAIDLGLDRERMQALLEEAAGRYPTYYSTYLEAARYYLPHWYGEAFDIDRLARFAAAHTGPAEGGSAYARVLWSTDECQCFNVAEVDRDQMKISMADIMRAYPNSWNAEAFARFSCRLGDAQEARKYYAQVTQDSTYGWRDEEEHSACRQFAGLPPTPAAEQ